MTSFALPRRQVLGDDVYEAITGLVMDNAIAPGERLNIDDLARRLDVSPTPVREALARLESDGLAVKLPLKGYRATELLSAAQVVDLYDLRLMIEAPSARIAAERRTPADVDALAAEMDTVPEAPSGSGYGDYRPLTAHDARLHELILAMSGNDLVRRTFLRLHCHLHIFRLTYGRLSGMGALAEHDSVAAAITSGDGDAAETAMRRHLMLSRDRVLAGISWTAPIDEGG